MPQGYIEVFYKISFLVISKTIRYMLKTNRKIILQMLYNKIYNKYFLILYNNINFYKKVQNY